MTGEPMPFEREPARPVSEAPRTTEQDVASGATAETPAVAMLGVVLTIAGLVAVALTIVGLAYWIAS